MTWQDYENAVFSFAQLLFSKGKVTKNVRIPDVNTDGSRQVDVLVEIEEYGANIKILFDAKKSARKLDVTYIEAIRSMADSVGADVAIIVSSNGFYDNAIIKANALRVRTFHLSEDNAKGMLEFDWKLCPDCLSETVWVDQVALGVGVNFFSGTCKNCKMKIVKRCSLDKKSWYFIAIPYLKSVIDHDGATWTNDGSIAFLPDERGMF